MTEQEYPTTIKVDPVTLTAAAILMEAAILTEEAMGREVRILMAEEPATATAAVVTILTEEVAAVAVLTVVVAAVMVITARTTKIIRAIFK